MSWVIIIIGAIILISALSSNTKKHEENIKKEEFNRDLESRTNAYCDLIRRKAENKDWLEMSEAELKEHIRTTIKRFNKEKGDADNISAFVLVAGLFVGVFFGAAKESWGVFFFFLAAGVGVGYILNKKLVEDIEKKYQATGFDVERLRISEWSSQKRSPDWRRGWSAFEILLRWEFKLENTIDVCCHPSRIFRTYSGGAL